ncbi:MAG TPA: class I tRNA ligase family protein, partial [Armatimonadota bacterium]|nr:class I tRNA ligase family protein [Armatimonadota bacterium]
MAREDPAACAHCGSAAIRQDEDVLDTWFSSGLWPFSTMGWPDETEDLRFFFPTSCLVTGYDIITFWVVRMVTLSLYFTGEIPFADVFIHGLVRNEQGKKISKSLGTAIDPMDLVDEWGADSLRFALAALITHGQDIKFSHDRLAAARTFCNKIYQASRFALMNLEDFDPDAPAPDRAELGLAERWILSRLRHVCEMTTQRVRAYDFGDLAMGLYEFIWGELCDWFLEMAKPSLHDKANGPKRRATQWTLWTAMHHTYRLLHPLMPFLSEELWHALPGTTGSVVVAPWPEPPAEWQDPQAEEAMRAQMDMAYGIRALRAQAEVPPQRTVTASVTSSSETTIAAVRAMLPTMEHILRARINVIPLGSAPPPQSLSLASGST